MIALRRDPDYRHAIAHADLAIADSGWLVVFWRLLKGEQLTRISGLRLFKALLELPEAKEPAAFFWILPGEQAQKTTLRWAEENGYPLAPETIATWRRESTAGAGGSEARRSRDSEGKGRRAANMELDTKVTSPQRSELLVPTPNPMLQAPRLPDLALLRMVQQRKPQHIIVAIGGGMQDKLGLYLKEALDYRPAIHCIGAAPGFVTGDQVAIPMWADRLYLGWLFRILRAAAHFRSPLLERAHPPLADPALRAGSAGGLKEELRIKKGSAGTARLLVIGYWLSGTAILYPLLSILYLFLCSCFPDSYFFPLAPSGLQPPPSCRWSFRAVSLS